MLQVIVERFGLMARFGFMHLVATNLCLWIRTIIWESANEWIHHIYRQKMAATSTPFLGPYAPEVASTPLTLEGGPIALGLRSSESGYVNFTKKIFFFVKLKFYLVLSKIMILCSRQFVLEKKLKIFYAWTCSLETRASLEKKGVTGSPIFGEIGAFKNNYKASL